MVCSLNEAQIKITRELTLVFLKSMESVPYVKYDNIIKAVFRQAYHAKILAGESELYANQFGLQAAEIAVDQLIYTLGKEEYKNLGSGYVDDLLKDVNKGLERDIKDLQTYLQTDSVGELTNLKNLLSLKEFDQNIQISPDNLTEEHKRSIENVKTALVKVFPKKFKTETREHLYSFAGVESKQMDFIGINTDEGFKHFLRVTQIGKGNDVMPFIQNFSNQATLRGTLFDDLIRLYFQKFRDKSYADFVKEVQTNSSLSEQFRKVLYTDNTVPDPKEFENLKNQMLSDIKFIVWKFKSAYDGYFLVDMSEIAKDVYEETLKVKGSLDFIAISPTGQIKVIDIKTTTTPSQVQERYKLQLSLYRLILKNAGFNVEDTTDLFVIHGDAAPVGGNRKFFRVINAEAKTVNPLSEEEIKTEVKKSFETFNKEIISKTAPVQDKKTPAIENYSKDLMKNFLKSKKGLPQSIKITEKTVTPLSLDRDIQWLKNIFPELGENAVQIIDTFNSPVGGKFLKDSFIFALNANEGVVYHEAWHRFSQLFLTVKEKKLLYEAVRNLNITFENREGVILHTKEISYLQAEEFLAEEFRKYVQDRDNYTFPEKKEVKNIFQKIWDFLQRLLKLKSVDPKFTEIFKNLHTGQFNRNNYSYENIMFNELFSSLKSGENGKELMGSYDFSNLVSIIDNSLHEVAHEEGDLLSSYFNTPEKLKGDFVEKLYGFLSHPGFIENILPDSLLKNMLKEGDTKYLRDLLHKYLMETRILSLRTQYRKVLNLKEVIDEKIDEVEGNKDTKDPEDSATRSSSKEEEEDNLDLILNEYSIFDQFNRSGHVNAYQIARGPIKEFFSGFRKANYKLYADELRISLEDDFALSTYMFNKTRETLIGTFSLSEQIAKLKDRKTLEVFPEARQVAEALERLEETRNNLINEFLASKDEDISLDILLYNSFAKTFQQLMGMDRLESINVFLDGASPRVNNDFQESFGSVVTIRNNIDNQLPTLFSDWNKNFQKIFRDRGETESFPNIVEAAVNGELFKKTNPVFTDGSTFYLNYKYFFDHEVFNKPLSSTSNADIISFFEMIGIKIPVSLFSNPVDEKRFRVAYENFKNILVQESELSKTFSSYSTSLLTNRKYLATISSYRSLASKKDKNPLEKERLKKLHDEVLRYIGPIYPHSPVRNILEQGLKNKKRANISVGTFYPLVVELGNILLKYSNKSSSGSVVLPTSKTKSRDLLPSVYSLTNTFLNGSKHIDDLLGVEFFKPLNFERNPALKNSRIISNLFNSDGTRNNEFSIGRQSVDNFSYRKPNGEIVNKEIGQLTPSEFVLYDMILTLTQGNGLMRRHESSNSQFRFLLLQNGRPIKPELITPERNTQSILDSEEAFEKVLKYMEFAKQFYFDSIRLGTLERNKKANKEFAHFTSILNDNQRKKGDLGEKVAKILDENKTVAEVLEEHPNLREQVKEKIANYFRKETEEMKNYIAGLDPTMRSVLHGMLAHRSHDNNFYAVDPKNKNFTIPDYLFENYVLMDHFNMMEDEVLYFGNNSLYSFAPKRRKYSINNGFVQYVSEDFKGFEEVLNKTSLTTLTRNLKGLDSLEKDPNHLYRVLLKDNPRFSPLLARNPDGQYKMIADIMELYSQWGVKTSQEDVLRDKAAVINALEIDEATGNKGKETSDSHSLISLDAYRSILITEGRWDYNEHEAWFRRQKLIYKRHVIGQDKLSQQELDFIESNKYRSAPPLKTAHTGPLLTDEALGHISIFDKMLQMPVIPEIYLKTDYEPLMHLMYEEGIDYYIFDSGTKAYKGEAFDYFSTPKSATETFGINIKNFDINKHLSKVHKMGHKFQLNTFNDKSVATLSVQLRSMFHKPLLEIKETLKGELSPEMRKKLESEKQNLEKKYDKFLKILSDLTDYNATRIFNDMGLTLQGTVANVGIDLGGKIINPSMFKKYLFDNVSNIDLLTLKTIVEQYSSIESVKQKITNSDLITHPAKLKMLDAINRAETNEEYVDISGTVEHPEKFMDFIKSRLNDSYTFEPTAIMQLEDAFKLDNIEEFSLALQTSSLSKEIKDIVKGMIDDIRVLKLTGRKLYQIPEIGLMRGGTVSTKRRDIYANEVLKPFGLIKNKKGEIIGTSPAEAKVSFTEEHHAPLLELTYHSKGEQKQIKGKTFEESLQNLNNALKDEEFLKQHGDKLTFIGVRIPLQDTNFSGRFIVKEFLPPSIQNVIVLPVELYVFMGSDNDADTITTIYKKLDSKGNIVKPTTTSYTDILRNIEELKTKLSTLDLKTRSTDANSSELREKRQLLVEQLTPFYGTDDLDLIEEDLTELETEDGNMVLKGKITKGTVLYKKYQKVPEIASLVDAYESAVNGEEILDSIEEIKESEKSIETKKLGQALRYYSNLKYKYEYGKTNELLEVFEDFYSHPLTYPSLINTDSLDNTQQSVERIYGQSDKIENMSVTVSLSSNVENYSNTFHIQSMLGMYVKAAKYFMILSLMDAEFSPLYKSTSRYNLGVAAKRFLNENVDNTIFTSYELDELRAVLEANQKRRGSTAGKKISELIDGYNGDIIEYKGRHQKNQLKAIVAVSDPILNSTLDKFFNRHFFKPFAEGDLSSSEAISLSLKDELGIPVTKNFSEIISSLLDLFKHADKFPKLNINWLNAKAHILLTLQGVSLQKSYLYFNTPMFKEFNRIHKSMSGRPNHKHVVYSFLQDYFPNNIISINLAQTKPKPSRGENANPGSSFDAYLRDTQEGEEETYTPDYLKIEINDEANFKLAGFIADVEREFFKIDKNTGLNIAKYKDHKESFTTLENFYKVYQEYLDGPETYKSFRNFVNYLKKNNRKDMLDYIEASAMYSYLLMEDGDALYRNYIKPMNQDSIKITSKLDLMEQDQNKYHRRLLSMLRTEEGYENSLVKTPTGHYDKLAKSKSNLLSFVSGDITLFDKMLGLGFDRMFINLATNVVHLTDDKKALFEDRVKSDFLEYFIKLFYVIPGKNTLGGFVTESMTAGFSVREKEVDDVSELSNIYDKRWFTNNLRAMKRKYPELFEHSTFLNALDDKIIRGIVTKNSVLDNLGKFNSHVRLTVELPGRPDTNERKEVYDTYKYEIQNILDLENYTSFLTKLPKDRLDFYKKNIGEINEFMETLHIFSLYKGISQSQGNFSHFFPESWNLNVVYSAIDNYKDFMKGQSNRTKVITELLADFQDKFMRLNSDYEFNDFQGEKYIDNSAGKPYDVVINSSTPVHSRENKVVRPDLHLLGEIEKFVLENNNIVEPVSNQFMVDENIEDIKIRRYDETPVEFFVKTEPKFSDVFFDTETTSAETNLSLWKSPKLKGDFLGKHFPITFAAKNRKTGKTIDIFLSYEDDGVILELLNNALNLTSLDGKLLDSSRELRKSLGIKSMENLYLSSDTDNRTNREVLEAWKKMPKLTPEELLKELETLSENNAPLSGFRVSHDTSAMINYFELHKKSLKGVEYFNYTNTTDAFELYKKNTGNAFHNLGTGNLTLQNLVTTFGIKKGDAAHSALSDVEDTIALAEVIERGISIDNIRRRQNAYMETQNMDPKKAYFKALAEEIERRKDDPNC